MSESRSRHRSSRDDHDPAAAKERGEKWPMITAYDALTAGLSTRRHSRDARAIPRPWSSTVTTRPSRSRWTNSSRCRRGGEGGSAMVVADLPFGSFPESRSRRLATATRCP